MHDGKMKEKFYRLKKDEGYNKLELRDQGSLIRSLHDFIYCTSKTDTVTTGYQTKPKFSLLNRSST